MDNDMVGGTGGSEVNESGNKACGVCTFEQPSSNNSCEMCGSGF